MKKIDTDSEFSLLYPVGIERPAGMDRWGEHTVEDLGIDQLAWAFSINNKYHIDNVVQRTYKIKPGPPRGLSYAKGIAAQHGISFEQLTERWREQQEQGSRK